MADDAIIAAVCRKMAAGDSLLRIDRSKYRGGKDENRDYGQL